MNYYDTLEVSQGASQEVIRAAYKSLLQRYHPDRNPGDKGAATRSVSIVEAYQVLSDPEKRAAYDVNLQRQRAASAAATTRRASYGKPAKPGVAQDERTPGFSLPLIVLAGVACWFAWLSFGGKSPVAPAPATSAATADEPRNNDGAGRAVARRVEAPASYIAPRTMPGYVENLKVTLLSQDKGADDGDADAKHVLSIKTIGIVVGSFDTERYIEFLERNKDHIGRTLAEKLARANRKTLAGENGGRYLKNFILDALGEITNTNRYEGYSLPGADSVAFYGAVDVLLPQSFTVESSKPDKAGFPADAGKPDKVGSPVEADKSDKTGSPAE